MPGHRKTVLVSYHLGQPGKLRDGLANGAILAVTHVGLAVALVLAGFAVIRKVFALGGRTPQFELASGVMIVAIGGFRPWCSLSRTTVDRAVTERVGLRDRSHSLSAHHLHHELRSRPGHARGGTYRHCGNDRRHDKHHRPVSRLPPRLRETVLRGSLPGPRFGGIGPGLRLSWGVPLR